MTGKLSYKIGDLIEAGLSGEVQILGHGCNCYVTMGNGIAPLIKIAFPYAYEADLQTTKGDISKLGTVSIAEPEEFGYDPFGPIVFNLYTQHGFWGRNKGLRDLDYNAIYNALSSMAEHLDRYDYGDADCHTVGLPKIGCGLASGDWDIVELMIKKTLCNAGHNVTIYVLDESETPENATVIE